MVMEVKGAQNLGRIKILSCMRRGRVYWDIGLCTGVGGRGDFSSGVGVDGTDGVGSDGFVGRGCGDSDGARSIGGS